MMGARIVASLLLLAGTLLVPCSLFAQNDDSECAAAAVAADLELEGNANQCFQLAVLLTDRYSEELILTMGKEGLNQAVDPREVMSREGQVAATGGSGASSEAIASARPMAAAGGSLAAVGGEGASATIAAITLNPALFMGKLDDAYSAARHSRMWDVTAFVPVDGLDADDDGSVDYVGLRLRLNALAAGIGRDLAAEAAAAYGSLVQNQAAHALELEALLRSAPNLDACLAVLLEGGDPAALNEECGEAMDLRPERELLDRFGEQLADLRAAIDGGYLGLDVRVDLGDPTLGHVPGASGTRIFGGVAFGKTIGESSPDQRSTRFRGRLGIRSVDLDDAVPGTDEDDDFQVEAGFGLEVVYPSGFQPVRLELGIDGRWGNSPEAAEEAFESETVFLRGALSVPFSESNAISVSFGAPIWGDGSPVLSVSTNWGLLLAGTS